MYADPFYLSMKVEESSDLILQTADVYSNGDSERIVAKAIKQFSIPRSKLVILSKCFFGVKDTNVPGAGLAIVNDGADVNQVGLSRKHIFDAVEASVQRLGTYIDVLQIHRLDRATPKKEIMRALNDVVERGWVRYLGASSMAAWEFQEYVFFFFPSIDRGDGVEG